MNLLQGYRILYNSKVFMFCLFIIVFFLSKFSMSVYMEMHIIISFFQIAPWYLIFLDGYQLSITVKETTPKFKGSAVLF